MDEPIPAVHTTTYHDKHSGHTHYFYVVYDGDEFDVESHCCCSDKFETCEPSQEAKDAYDERNKRRNRAKGLIRDIIDQYKTPADCPVCGGGSVKRVDNEWVRRQIHHTPEYDDPDPVYFCTDCEANIWSSYGNVSGGLRIGMNAIEEGADVSLSKNYGGAISSSPKSKKARLIKGPEKFETTLAQFSMDLQRLRREHAVDGPDLIPEGLSTSESKE